MTNALRFVHHATVALVPPSTPADRVAVWERLQGTRATLKDRGYYRWPPHINLLYPYLDPASDVHGEVLPALAAAAATVSPFRVTLKTLGTFGGHTRGVLWLDTRAKWAKRYAKVGNEGRVLCQTGPGSRRFAAAGRARGILPLPPAMHTGYCSRAHLRGAHGRKRAGRENDVTAEWLKRGTQRTHRPT